MKPRPRPLSNALPPDVSSRSPPLSLSLQFADSRHRGDLPRHRVQRTLRAALAVCGLPGRITVRVVDADEGQMLNRDYRGQDHATNVLTFDYEKTPEVVADLVLCAPVVAAEAAAAQLPLQAHYAHLLVHGALHAQGFDHLEDAAAAVMEAHESRIVQALGYADPHGMRPA